jgi:GcrA cell cycle regulator
MDWTEDVIVRLRALWAEGHSTAEIGRRLGVSKNAVVGKAHRLELPARPSPIRRDGAGPARARAPRRISGPTLPPLTCTRAVLPEAGPAMAQAAGVAVAVQRPALVNVVARAQPQARPYARIVSCCWPIGEPGSRGFRFCDAESLPGKPYCSDHAAVAYVRIKDRRDDAA